MIAMIPQQLCRSITATRKTIFSLSIFLDRQSRYRLRPITLLANRARHSSANLDISYEHGAPENLKYFDPSTLGQLLERSTAKTPNKLALIVHHQQLSKTYAEFNQDVDQLAKALLAIGCRRGDKVGMWAVNSYQWLLVQFATAKIGCVLITLNPGYKELELINCLNLVQLKTLICNQSFKTSNYCNILNNVSPNILSTANGHRVNCAEIPSLTSVIVLDQSEEIAPPNVMRFSELLRKGDNDRQLSDMIEPNEQANFDDVINVQFTSGTTGSPKGAMLTHHNIMQNVNFSSPRMFEGFESGDTQSPVICLPNPLYHCFGCVFGSTAAIYLNGTLVLPGPIFSPAATLEAIDQYRCNYLYGTPTMWSDLLNVGVDKFDLTCLKRGVMSGAPCPPILMRKVRNEIPSLENILIPYGSTELSPTVTLTSIRDDSVRQLETVGRPLDFIEVKIIDPVSGRIMPRGEKGEICARGHGTFAGYINQKEATAEVVDSNFWYHTGDIGFLDNDGYLTVSGRIKEMIIRGGENIYPREVEEFILLHESVEDVHVVGIPDERFGEELVAYVKLKEGEQSSVNEKNLKEFLKPKISHFKLPKHFCFVDNFPRTMTGKVRKVELKEIALKQFTQKQK